MELVHVLNRGVDGRQIYMDDRDRARFVHNLYEFNDTALAGSTYYSFRNLGLVNPDLPKRIREKLVEIYGWVLMKNHYHLLLSELVEGGLSLFLRKLNTGYANYFNLRHERKGTLFQGRTKKILIERQAHFLYILHYIHLNPLDYLKGFENWRERSKGHIPNAREALKYLETYRWSSYLDYAGKKNFPSLITKDFFEDRPDEYAVDLRDYLRSTVEPHQDFAKLWLE